MNILILSVGTRRKLVTYFKQPKNGFSGVIVTDCSKYAPALYVADQYYIVPRMENPGYLQILEEICEKESINVILPLNENELQFMADNRKNFEQRGIMVAVSGAKSIALCRDKYSFYQALEKAGIPCIKSFKCEKDSLNILENVLEFPVFIKPRYGAGSKGSLKVSSFSLLKELVKSSEEELIVQPFIEEKQYDADVYIDFESKEVIAIFAKEKLRMKAGEADKAKSVKDKEIFDLIQHVTSVLNLLGPIDIDLFFCNGKYHILEINPRFGGVYPHAYECGVNFPYFLSRNAKGFCNFQQIGEYQNHVLMLRFSDIMLI